MNDFFARMRGTRGVSSLTVNGTTYFGNSIQISNGRVLVDGKEVADHAGSPKIEVNIHGDVDTIEAGSGDVRVNGNAGVIRTGSGDVECRDVAGTVTTGSGNVRCSAIAGNASTGSGNIRR